MLIFLSQHPRKSELTFSQLIFTILFLLKLPPENNKPLRNQAMITLWGMLEHRLSSTYRIE